MVKKNTAGLSCRLVITGKPTYKCQFAIMKYWRSYQELYA